VIVLARRLSLLLLVGCLFSENSFAQMNNSSATKKGSTYIAGFYNNYTGNKENSLVGTQGFGLNITSTTHRSHFRLIYGGILSFSDDAAYIANTRYGATLYSADAIVGVSIYPFVNQVKVRPFLEVTGLAGFKFLEILRPPTGVDNQSTGLSFGYRLAIGMEAGTNNGLRFTVDYISNKAKLANTSDFQLDGFGASFGFFF
jgi:hypothetical protein